MKEENDKAVSVEETMALLSQNIATLSFMVTELTAVCFATLKNLKDHMEAKGVYFVAPRWETEEDIEKDIGELLKTILERQCGQSKTDKS